MAGPWRDRETDLDGIARSVWLLLDQPQLGQAVRLLRRFCRMSRDGLASALHQEAGLDAAGVDEVAIWRWEAGRTKDISRPYRKLLAAVCEHEVLAMDPVNRREFLTKLGALAGLASLPGVPLLSIDAERLIALVGNLGPVDEVVIGDFERIAAEYARRSHQEAPGPLLVAVHSHLSALGTLLTDSRREGLQNRLLAVTGETARLAGWLSYLIENRAAANAYYDRGLALARASGDGLLVGRLLVAKSLLYSNLGEDVEGPTGTTGTVIGMLQQAIDAAGSQAPARLTVWAHERLAVEHASGRDERAAVRFLERAHTLLDTAPPHGAEGPTHWDAIWLDAYSGNVRRLLGRPRDAISLLEGSLRDVNPQHGYDQSVYWSALGIAHASVVEIEGACEAFSRSLSVALEHRLPSRVRQVIAARPRLTPWEDSPHVKRLDQELETARW